MSINFNRITLKQALAELHNKSGYNFLYNSKLIDDSRLISINKSDTELSKILDELFTDTNIRYSIDDKQIVLYLSSSAENTAQAGKPASATTVDRGANTPSNNSMQSPGMANVSQSRTVRGTVMDETGFPLPGAAIVVKGNTKKNTTTNGDGKFELTDVEPNAILIVSFMGYETLEYPVNNRIILEVALKPSTVQLEEVVVTGIFTRKEESFTGSATTFKAEQIKSMGNQNLLTTIKNLDPAFMIQDNLSIGSDPNQVADIQVRGSASLASLSSAEGNPNLPLFILDGFEASAQKIYDMDMNRVQSVTLLKDAAAKAIYGSKAANGVVVIETKLPSEGRLKVTFTGDFNVSVPDLTSYNLTNASEKLQVEVMANRYVYPSPPSLPNPALTQKLQEQYNAIYKDIARGVDTYWLSQPLHTGYGYKGSLFLEGGDPYFRYEVNLSYNHIAGVMKGSQRNTISGGIKLMYRYKNISFRNYLEPNLNNADDSPFGSFQQYALLNPYWVNKDENGNVKKVLGTFTNAADYTTPYYNPYYNGTLNTEYNTQTKGILDNFFVEWKILQNLKLTGRLGFTYLNTESRNYWPASHTDFTAWTGDNYFRRGAYSIFNGASSTFDGDATLSYSLSVGKHLIFANANAKMSSVTTDSYGLSAEGFIDDQMDHIAFAKQYTQNGKPFGAEGITRSAGFLGAVNYSYDNRYLFDASLRGDGSSIYGSNNHWGTFWSVGIGWNLHNEAFMKNVKALNRLKLRSSIGTTGAQSFNPYQALTRFTFFTNIYYNNIIGTRLIALGNENLKWQETQDFNVGFDLDLWNRLSIRYDYYISTTNDLLTDVTLPTSTGFSSYVENLGKSQNRGMEILANYKIFNNAQKGTFLSIFASAATNKNKLLEISNALQAWNNAQDAKSNSTVNQKDATTPTVKFKEGQSMSAIWAVRSLGINPADGKEIFLDKNGQITNVWNASDQVITGDNTPKMRGTFGLTGQWAGWSGTVSFGYRIGGEIYNQTLVSRVENANTDYNVDRRVFTDRWNTPGDVSYYKSITDRSWTRPSSRFVEERNELNLSVVNLSYDFAHLKFMKKSPLERCKLSFYMNNVFTLSSVKIERGLDYPFARTFSFSLQVIF